MKQSTLFGRPAVKRKTTEGVAEAGSPAPKVAKSFSKQWLKDFQWLEHTDGCGDLDHLSTGVNSSHSSRTIAYRFLETFSDVIEEELLEKLHASPYISILIDESTGITVSKKLIIYVKYILEGRDKTSFLCNLEIPNGTAAAIKEVIDHYVENIRVPLSKIVGFGSDGAAVMLGSKNGVATKLREDSPFMLNVHCIAHRFALCTGEGASKVTLVRGFVDTLTSLYYFFEHSSLHCSKLQSVQEALKEPVLSVKEVHSVRWLAFFSALDSVFRCWVSIVTTLGNEASDQGKGNAKAKGLLKAMTKFSFLATMHFLMDVVPIMQRSARVEFITKLTENLRKRFPASQSSIVSAFSVLDYKSSVSLSRVEREAKLGVLLDHYGQEKGGVKPLVDPNGCKLEYQLLEPLVKANYCGLSMRDLWAVISTKYNDQFPELIKLAQIATLIPVSTADSERGFSYQNRTKVKSRARLSGKTVNQLLRININGVDYKHFDFNKALTRWRASERRIF
ncbi:zinc finger protein 862-like [Acropora palmata]|uniref:zinc finger protein 862-like n=1 Tax=Acropora palmata TaxID=6131 RepID=UPI003DA16CCF